MRSSASLRSHRSFVPRASAASSSTARSIDLAVDEQFQRQEQGAPSTPPHRCLLSCRRGVGNAADRSVHGSAAASASGLQGLAAGGNGIEPSVPLPKESLSRAPRRWPTPCSCLATRNLPRHGWPIYGRRLDHRRFRLAGFGPGGSEHIPPPLYKCRCTNMAYRRS